MLKNILLVFLIILLIIPSLETFAANTLFRQATESEIENARKTNHEYLVKTLYTAKRHQFLIMNPDVLNKDEDITIQFFDDKPITFKFKKREERDGSVTWIGSYDTAEKYILSNLFNDGDNESKDFLKYITKPVREIRISALTVDVIRNEDGSIKYHRAIWDREKHDPDIIPGDNLETVKQVTLSYSDYKSDKKYFIQKLPQDPNVHLLKQHKKRKTYHVHGGFRNATDREKQRIEDEKYLNYLKENGLVDINKSMDDIEKEEISIAFNKLIKKIEDTKDLERKEFLISLLAIYERERNGPGEKYVKKIKKELTKELEKSKKARGY